MLVTVASELRMVIVMSALRIGVIRMKNKEKFSKEIVEIACDGYSVAADKRTDKMICALMFLVINVCFLTAIIVIRKEENGRNPST